MGMCTHKSSHQDTQCYTKPYYFPHTTIILSVKTLNNDETSNTFMYIERFIDIGPCFVQGQSVQHTQASPCMGFNFTKVRCLKKNLKK